MQQECSISANKAEYLVWMKKIGQSIPIYFYTKFYIYMITKIFLMTSSEYTYYRSDIYLQDVNTTPAACTLLQHQQSSIIRTYLYILCTYYTFECVLLQAKQKYIAMYIDILDIHTKYTKFSSSLKLSKITRGLSLIDKTSLYTSCRVTISQNVFLVNFILYSVYKQMCLSVCVVYTIFSINV